MSCWLRQHVCAPTLEEDLWSKMCCPDHSAEIAGKQHVIPMWPFINYHIYINNHIIIYVYLYIYICMCMCMCTIYVYSYIYVLYICIDMTVYGHACIHVYIHVYNHI